MIGEEKLIYSPSLDGRGQGEGELRGFLGE